MRVDWKSPASRWICTAAEMRDIDARTIAEIGIAGPVLMEAAGRAVFDRARELFGGNVGRRRVLVVCGSGNNGGDGFVAARLLQEWGADVTVVLAAERSRLAGDAATNCAIAARLEIPLLEAHTPEAFAHLGSLGSSAELVVDALLGTGLSSPVRGTAWAAIEFMNASPAIRLGVDIPSGVSADTGQVLGAAVTCDATVTFGLPKIGLLQHPGAHLAGEVRVVDIGVPASVIQAVRPRVALFDRDAARTASPSLGPAAHKGTYGHVLLIAGSPGKAGAALLASRAALRGGAGLATLATDATTQARLEGQVLEVMSEVVRLAPQGPFDLARIDELLQGKRVVVAGPGLGSGAEVRELVESLLRSTATLVLDADALTSFTGDAKSLFIPGTSRLVLTPHPGEAARLLGCSTSDVQADRIAAARTLAARANGIVVLKGAGTVVAEPSGDVELLIVGNEGMGTAGAGDVLAGLIAGAVSRWGLSPEVVSLAGYIHGVAGDVAATTAGKPALIASDILSCVGAAWNLTAPSP